MNKFLFIIALSALLAACGQTAKSSVEQHKVSVNADSLGMADAIHTFFKWYGENQEQLNQKMDFINTTGKHATLDLSLLARYLGEYSKSGAICSEFIQNETVFYRACSLAWANEDPKDMLTGFEADRYYCSQDEDASEFLSAAISSQITGDRATVQLLLKPDGPNGGPRSFEMKKENGKWLLSKNLCESAVLH